jgi:hypothetical protein
MLHATKMLAPTECTSLQEKFNQDAIKRLLQAFIYAAMI